MIKRQIFFSFHYDNDHWRAAKIRNIGVIGSERSFSDNNWEEVRFKSEDNIKRWIDSELSYRSCTVVLVGSETANRKWVQYEIKRSWELGKGILGIRINRMTDALGKTSNEGENPFSKFIFTPQGKIIKKNPLIKPQLSPLRPQYTPPPLTPQSLLMRLQPSKMPSYTPLKPQLVPNQKLTMPLELMNFVRLYCPISATSSDIYRFISINLNKWVDYAIEFRNKYPL